MAELGFRVIDALAVPHSAAPAVALRLELVTATPVRYLALQTQVRIDAPARRYTATEQDGLRELFGEPARWSQTLRGVLWANVTTTVGPFSESAEIEVQLPVTFDFSVSAAKYFEAVEGEVPLRLFFSGTVFHTREDGALQAALLPWSSEARFAFPAALWRRTLDLHFPNRAALQLERGVVERLRRFQADRGLVTLERALEVLLESAA
jgi:hypothetical protein